MAKSLKFLPPGTVEFDIIENDIYLGTVTEMPRCEWIHDFFSLADRSHCQVIRLMLVISDSFLLSHAPSFCRKQKNSSLAGSIVVQPKNVEADKAIGTEGKKIELRSEDLNRIRLSVGDTVRFKIALSKVTGNRKDQLVEQELDSSLCALCLWWLFFQELSEP